MMQCLGIHQTIERKILDIYVHLIPECLNNSTRIFTFGFFWFFSLHKPKELLFPVYYPSKCLLHLPTYPFRPFPYTQLKLKPEHYCDNPIIYLFLNCNVVLLTREEHILYASTHVQPLLSSTPSIRAAYLLKLMNLH